MNQVSLLYLNKMKIITNNKKNIAFIFDGKYKSGTHGLTEAKLPLQVISLNHPKGKVWPAHFHKPRRRVTTQLHEVFFITKGKARVQILLNKKVFKTLTLKENQGIMVLKGAIQIEALSNLIALEFKNGPFLEDKELL